MRTEHGRMLLSQLQLGIEVPPTSKIGARLESVVGETYMLGAVLASSLKFLPVCEAKLARVPPLGEAWLYQPKLDGWRLEAVKDGARVRLFSRNGADMTHRLKPIAKMVGELKEERCILDGEAVAIGRNGQPDFRELHSASQDLAYYVFDLLWLGERDLRMLPLSERLAILQQVQSRSPSDRLLMIESFSDADKLLKPCDVLGLEGIISKLRSSHYRAGPNSSWLKTKCAAWREANCDRGDLFKPKWASAR